MDKNIKSDISIIIPTVGAARRKDLIKVLQSIEANTVQPLEVLIINQGKLDVKDLENFNLNLTLVNIDKKSLTQAENIGVDLARGEIVSILDDDVILDDNYYKEVLESFTKYGQIKIVQGKITNFKTYKIREFFWGLFEGPGSLKKSNYVRPFNFEGIFYKSYSNSEEFCMWASGCNMNVIKDVFVNEKFDSQQLRYSLGEDLDFSFRIYKRYGFNSILFQPRAKLVHNASLRGRLSKYEEVLARIATQIYFNYKHKNIAKRESVVRICRRLWHDFGLFLFYVFRIFKGDYKSWFYFFIAQYQAWTHRREMKNLDIEWMNLKLFKEKSTPTAIILEKMVKTLKPLNLTEGL